MNKKYHRKYFHILATTPAVVLGLFIDTHIPRYAYVIIALAMLVVFLALETYRLRNNSLKEKLKQKIGFMYKEKEDWQIVSSIWGPVNLLLLVLFFSRPTVVLTLFVGSYCDPIAALFGMKYGKKPNRNGKTWAGTAALFVSAVIFMFLASAIIGFSMHYLLVLALAAFAALVERYIVLLDDNFAVPMSFAIALEALTVWIIL